MEVWDPRVRWCSMTSATASRRTPSSAGICLDSVCRSTTPIMLTCVDRTSDSYNCHRSYDQQQRAVMAQKMQIEYAGGECPRALYFVGGVPGFTLRACDRIADF